MIGPQPKFMESPYFVEEPGNWHLLPGAPDDVVREFQEFITTMDGDSLEE